LSRVDSDSFKLRTGYGFPTTFGLVIAAILSVIAIQLFVLRDKRGARISSVDSEHGITSDITGAGIKDGEKVGLT
jgi:ACS family pantothenate transporter-like MFS transporter